MKPAYKILWLLTALVLAAALPGLAFAKAEFNKTIRKEFPISPNGTTYLSNKYGKVDVKTWDQNRVKVTVNIIVKANSESAAKDVFDRISIQFSNGTDYVKAETSIEPTRGWSWNWLGSDKSDYSINYEVYLPASNNLEVTHRYGDMYVASMKGRVKLDVKYVNFKVEGMGENSSMLFGYGNGTVLRAGNLSTDVSYSKLTVEEAGNLNILSKYTQVNVSKANDLTATSKYDTYNLGQIQNLKNTGAYDNFKIAAANSIDISSKYTQVKAEKVVRYVNCDFAYGNVEVKMAEGFSKANCTGSYTNYKIGVPEAAGFALDASTTYAGCSYPEDLDVEYLVEKNNSKTIKGKAGKGGAAAIMIRLNYGGAKVFTY